MKCDSKRLQTTSNNLRQELRKVANQKNIQFGYAGKEGIESGIDQIEESLAGENNNYQEDDEENFKEAKEDHKKLAEQEAK